MTPSKIPFKKINTSKYSVYRGKARDCFNAMMRSYGEANWHSAGLEAVHCAISLTDAMLVNTRGIRPSGTSHMEAVYLLTDNIRDAETKKYADTLRKILEMKNLVEYEDRAITAKEAAEMVKRTERYYNWVLGKLPRMA